MKKYKKIRHSELSNLIKLNLKRIKSNSNDENYGYIKLNKTNACPLLSPEKLCTVQEKFGEEYLSNVCSTYPREINQINGVLEYSTTLSCPAAAKLALLNPDGIEFDEGFVGDEERISVNKVLFTDHPNLQDKAEKYFWDIRFFTIEVLQNRNYSIAERLIVLGMLIKNLQEANDHQRINDFPHIISRYRKYLKEDMLKEALSEIPEQPIVQIMILNGLMGERIAQGILNKRYSECYSEFLKGIEMIKWDDKEDIIHHYNEINKSYYRPFFISHEYIYENYLVNYAFKNLFPFSKDKSLFDEYIMMVIHYSLIKLHLIGMASFHKSLNVELVVKLIQSFVKTVDHDRRYLKSIMEILQKNEYTSLPYMAILIKN